MGITPVKGTLNDLFSHQLFSCKFDFIYCSNLLDHLDAPLDKNVIKRMFGLLQHGGSLFVSNFRESVSNTLYRTYLEAFANWFMKYRCDEELINLFDQVNPEKIAEFELTTDPFCNISYVILKKSLQNHDKDKLNK